MTGNAVGRLMKMTRVLYDILLVEIEEKIVQIVLIEFSGAPCISNRWHLDVHKRGKRGQCHVDWGGGEKSDFLVNVING